MNDQTSAGAIDSGAITSTSTEPDPQLAPSFPELNGTEVWAICCSGGGIRSASYCLGAFQGLEEGGFLDRARLILGVSGGSYISASRALVAHGLADGADGADAPGLPPYAPGSPEEQHLRDNTRYLVPDAKTLLAGVLSLLFGVAVTLVLVLTPVFAVAHVWGWVLRSSAVLTYAVAPHSRTQQWTAALTGTTWWIWPVIAAGVTFFIFLWWWATLMPSPRGQERHSQVAVKALGWAAFITVVLATAMFAVPGVVAWLSSSHSAAFRTVLDDLGFGSGAGWTPAAVGGFVAAVLAVSQSARKTLVKYNLISTPEAAPGATPEAAQGADAPKPGTIAKATGYLRGLLLPWLASVLIVLAFAVSGLRWVKDGAAAGFTAGQAGLVIGALAVMLVMRFLADANRISLHDFYRWRLATAYSVTRDTGQEGSNQAPFGTKDAPGALLSQLSGQQPELVMCTTANINERREVPAGRGGLSFAFDPDYATLRGGPDPTQSVRARTTDYEALVGRRRFTLFDVSAISGAAFSPLMGSATKQAFRILFTATDLRLGVWLPHPAIVRAAAKELERQQATGNRADHWWQAVGLLLWYMVPHPGWRHGDEKPERREARLWAYVLKLRRDGNRAQQFFGGLLYHGLQPTLGMLYAEAAGHTSYRGTWMCVTDGGHYDNLGLVEALQRAPHLGITHILVLDASGDKADTWYTLGGSIALARTEAGTDIVINPTTMTTAPEGKAPEGSAPEGKAPEGSAPEGSAREGKAPKGSAPKGKAPKLAPGEVVSPWVSGTFTFTRQVSPGTGRDRTIVVCKLGWWSGAPWDVRAYAAAHPTYPTDSTLEQLYDSAEFDAYRELGASTAELAMQECKLGPFARQ
jgi:hypothetical protein